MTFLITGVGRSGTSWAARLVTALGHRCLHETQYTPWRHGPPTMPEASWLAAPYVEALRDDVLVVLVCRNPFDVVRSNMARRFLSDARLGEPYDMFAMRHQAGIADAPDQLGRVIRWVAGWETANALPTSAPCLYVDSDTDERVAEVVEYATGERPDRERVKHLRAHLGHPNASAHKPATPSDDEIVRHPEGWRIETRAALHGYGWG